MAMGNFLDKQKRTVSINDFLAAEQIRPKWLNSPLIPAAVMLLLLLPFVGKAVHIDDPLFIWSAQQIQKHPFNFYGFNVNWDIREMPMHEVMKNPPLASYYIAALGTFFGYGEIALHLGFILPAIAVAVGTFYLSRYFCSSAVTAALIAVLNPVFLVSATTLMCDVMMLAFWVWALYFWIGGIEAGKQWYLLSAAVLTIFCVMAKYFGLSLIPLMAVYAVSRKPRFGRWIVYWLLPLVAIILYQWWTFSLYGKGLLSDAQSYASKVDRWQFQILIKAILISLAFTGGCFISVLFYSYLSWSRKTLLKRIVPAAVLIGLLCFFPLVRYADVQGTGKFGSDLMVTMGLMIIGGIILLALATDELRKYRDMKTLFIFLWIIGTFVFAGFINWTINARSLLPIAPAAGILIAGRLEQRGISGWFKRLIPLIPAGLISVAVAWADYSLANSARAAVEVISKAGFTPDNTCFEGHWGFQYYMEKAGFKPLDPGKTKILVGGFLVIPMNNTNITMPPPNVFSPKKDFEFIPCSWVSTMNPVGGAGFYSCLFGPVPFVFGRIPPDNYYIMEKKSVWTK
jgi:4-amino-4-deoxy-L-arabinose transferase-like glycosyltransferase